MDSDEVPARAVAWRDAALACKHCWHAGETIREVASSPVDPAKCSPLRHEKISENETGPAAGDSVAASSIILSAAKDLIAIAVLVRFFMRSFAALRTTELPGRDHSS